jgi:hypothetical protein
VRVAAQVGDADIVAPDDENVGLTRLGHSALPLVHRSSSLRALEILDYAFSATNAFSAFTTTSKRAVAGRMNSRKKKLQPN